MISIIVERGDADKQGDDIVDPLITSEAVAVDRGRNELDMNCSDRILVSSVGPYKEFFETGKIIEVSDSEQELWNGMIKSASLVLDIDNDTISANMNLTIEKLVD